MNKILGYTGAVILLASAVILLLHNRNNASDNSISSHLLPSITPTPYPLPTTAFDLLPFLTITPGTISEEIAPFIDPTRIETDGHKLAENEYLDLYSLSDYLSVDIPWWQEESKQVYEYVSKRLGTVASGRFIVTFVPPESSSCPHRGLTFPEAPMVAIFADENTSKEQILGILAHELGHVLSFQKYKNLMDLALSEGIATWAAGDYWKEWKGYDFNSGVKMFINSGKYMPLFENYDLKKAYDDNVPDCLAQRDILYTELASLLDYLIQSYGHEKLAALFNVPLPETVNNKRVVYPPNYKGVYGLEFNQLEYEWRKTLLQSGQ